MSSVRAAIRNALERIGHYNGHACPQSQSNVDALLHEAFVAAEGANHFKNRQEAARKALLDEHVDADRLDEAVTRVTKTKTSEGFIGVTGDVYALQVDITKGYSRLDQKKLATYLQVQHGLTADDVAEAFDACSEDTKPAKRLKVTSL